MTKIILAGAFGIVTVCALAGICDPPPARPGGHVNIRPVTSEDPNEIVGPFALCFHAYTPLRPR